MADFNKQGDLFISCYKLLRPYLQKEVEDLGYTITDKMSTGVALQGSLNDAILLNLRLRTASQIFFAVGRFEAEDANALYDAAYAIPWEDWLLPDGYLSISSHVVHPSINNPMYANTKLKDAVVDRLRNKFGRRPDTGPLLSKAVVHLYWTEDEAILYVDTSGESLAKHGYRMYPGKAPMLESLAAACILAGSWDRQSPFINPMCGSGTLAIEAALLASKRYPGLLRRNYGFMHLAGFDKNHYMEAVLDLEDEVVEPAGLYIHASDHSREALRIAELNAKKAGVADYIRFEKTDFRRIKLPDPGSAGVIYINPEYGERLGELDELTETYREIGDFLKKEATAYKAYVFTANPDLAKQIGLSTSARISFFNGRLESRLLEFVLFAGKQADFKKAASEKGH